MLQNVDISNYSFVAGIFIHIHSYLSMYVHMYVWGLILKNSKQIVEVSKLLSLTKLQEAITAAIQFLKTQEQQKKRNEQLFQTDF